MPLESRYNLKSPGVKRLMREAIELANPTEEYYASPLEDNLFEWHFTVRGPPSTEFEGGYYHGRILLPSQYPMQPPNIILLTPNGRFEVNKKICLSISGHHPESWQPSWSIRTALLALIAFMPTSAAGTIGALEYTKEERQTLAKKSKNWECLICGKISEKLSTSNQTRAELTLEESSLISQIALKGEEEGKKIEPSSSEQEELCDKIENVEIRQRITIDTSSNEVTNITGTQHITEPIESYDKNVLWTAAVWIILLLIAVLVIRRIFFL